HFSEGPPRKCCAHCAPEPWRSGVSAERRRLKLQRMAALCRAAATKRRLMGRARGLTPAVRFKQGAVNHQVRIAPDGGGEMGVLFLGQAVVSQRLDRVTGAHERL